MPDDGGSRFKPGNTTPEGDYRVGKGRPPENGKFRKGDGRKRGRRSKGTRNLASDLREVLDSPVSVTVGGSAKRVTRQRAVVMRMADNATKGQTSAIALLLELQQRLVDPMLQEEAQRLQREQDLTCLSDVELDALIYLSAKLGNAEEMNTDVVGVVPIYRAGHYLSSHIQKDIEAGLASYGVTDHQLPSCSFGLPVQVGDENAPMPTKARAARAVE